MSVFREYELLRTSGLFDHDYYLTSNPDVATSSIDPLLHYLEHGAREGRNPRPDFDVAYYLSQCQQLGENPANPLIHFITVGASRGLGTRPVRIDDASPIATKVETVAINGAPAAEPENLLFIDLPRIVGGAADTPVKGGLSIAGWAIAGGPVESIQVAIDGQVAAVAHHGMRRPDVAAQFPERESAMQSGYVAHVPPRALTLGTHLVTITLRDGSDVSTNIDFRIEVEEVPENRGPWSLRRKMSQAEVDVQMHLLAGLSWHPLFLVLLPLSGEAQELMRARRSLESLSTQTYSDWCLCLIPTGGNRAAPSMIGQWRQQLTEGLDELGRKVVELHVEDSAVLADGTAADRPSLVCVLAAGDEWGCDALLEFALASGFDRNADFFYCDDRRKSPTADAVEAYFKPQWSPDLLLSSNYIGRSWCATSELVARAGFDLSTLASASDYSRVLRLTEAAHARQHVAKVLCLNTVDRQDGQQEERRALAEALERRTISAEILPGCAAGYYRLKRKVAGREKVSIIIPTCAAGGLVKTCIETLRASSAYPDYEIICIENIPAAQPDWKRWLRQHADVVVETHEPFNWSRYNNLAAEEATGTYLLFLNDDIEIIEPDWLAALVEHAQRPEVGVVGPQLLYPNRTVQHAGVMLDQLGRGRHAFRHLAEDDPGYFGLALTQRNVISLTGACLLTRRDTFDALGRFNEEHAVINNDLDYCLRAWQKGLLNLYTPYARLIHHELVSRAKLKEAYEASAFEQTWRKLIAKGDPYFNPNLSREHEPFTIEREPVQILHAGHPVYARESIRRILVVKLDHIGDCITGLPALRRLKHHFPEASITVLAGGSTMSIWKNEPAVDETIEFSYFNARSGLGKMELTEQDFTALQQTLRPKRFDLAIDLRKQPDTRHILQYTGARILAGFDHQGRFPWIDIALEWDEDVPLRAKRTHVADDLIALVEAVAINGERDRHLIAKPQTALSLPEAEQQQLFARPLICIHAASGSKMRQWPLHYFAELIDLLLDEARFNIALIGGPDEKEFSTEVINSVRNKSESVFDLVGKIKLAELPALLAKASLFVGNNSGPQHLAAGLGVPTIGIHSGVVDANEWAPLGPNAVAIRREMSCSPCFIERPTDCPRQLACLKDLSPAAVFSQCAKMLPQPSELASSFLKTPESRQLAVEE